MHELISFYSRCKKTFTRLSYLTKLYREQMLF